MKVLLWSYLLCICFFSQLKSSSTTCGGLQGDVVFVLDASGSIGSSNFQLMLQFVNDLVDDFDIGSDLVRVGVVKYASSVYTELHLNDHFNKASVKSAISSIYYTSGGTYTHKALEQVRTSMFTSANGDRSAIPNIAIVITDGVSSSSPTSQAALARAAGITIFAIGVGTAVSELNDMASDPDSDHVFTVSSFNGLSSIEGAFKTKACTSNTFTSSNLTTTTAITFTTTAGAPTGNAAAAIAGGVVAGVVVLAVVGVILKSKMVAGKIAVQSVNAGNVVVAAQQSMNSQPSQPTQMQMISTSLTIDAPAQVQPMDTQWLPK
ncbi:hypothetical protein ACOMHN_004675 [Nucella lapillus]